MVILGCLGTFAITWSIANDDSEGPFYLYKFVRWLASSKIAPKLVRDNSGCPYCISFWVGTTFALSIMATQPFATLPRFVGLLFILTYGFHGFYVLILRYLKLIYALDAKDF